MSDSLTPDGTLQAAPEGGTPAAGGNAIPAWTAQLPDPHKGNETLTKFQTIGDLAGDYLGKSQEVEALKGQVANSIPRLADDATDEQKAAYYTALGRPETPEEYELPTPPLPEGMQVNPVMDNWYRKTAHDLGLSVTQAKALYEGYNGFVVEQTQKAVADREASLAAGMEAVKAEWGNNYDANKEIVRRAQEKYGNDPDFKKYLTESNAENNPVLVKFFLAVGKAMLDDTTPETAGSGGSPPAKIGIEYKNMEQFQEGG